MAIFHLDTANIRLVAVSLANRSFVRVIQNFVYPDNTDTHSTPQNEWALSHWKVTVLIFELNIAILQHFHLRSLF